MHHPLLPSRLPRTIGLGLAGFAAYLVVPTVSRAAPSSAAADPVLAESRLFGY